MGAKVRGWKGVGYYKRGEGWKEGGEVMGLRRGSSERGM